MATDNIARGMAGSALSKVKSLPTAFKVKPAVATKADLPMSGNEEGDVRQTLDDGQEYYWDGTAWQEYGIDNAVSYNAQTKTQSEKAQARANIGALGDVDFIQLIQADSHTTKETYVVPVLTDEQIVTAYNGVVAGRNVFIVDDLDTLTLQVIDASSIDTNVSITVVFRDKLILTYQVGEDVVATKFGTELVQTISATADVSSQTKAVSEKGLAQYIASGNDGAPRTFSNISLNSITATGFYYCDVCTNRPINANGIMIVSRNSSGNAYVMQTYFAFAEDKVFVRFRDANTWKDWQQIYNKTDVDSLLEDKVDKNANLTNNEIDAIWQEN